MVVCALEQLVREIDERRDVEDPEEAHEPEREQPREQSSPRRRRGVAGRGTPSWGTRTTTTARRLAPAVAAARGRRRRRFAGPGAASRAAAEGERDLERCLRLRSCAGRTGSRPAAPRSDVREPGGEPGRNSAALGEVAGPRYMTIQWTNTMPTPRTKPPSLPLRAVLKPMLMPSSAKTRQATGIANLLWSVQTGLWSDSPVASQVGGPCPEFGDRHLVVGLGRADSREDRGRIQSDDDCPRTR